VAKQFTLGKNERLKSRKLIEQLFSEGKNFSSFPFRIYYLVGPLTIHNSQFTIQFGAGVSTKNFKKAVDRNRIKRLTREAYRLQKKELQEILRANNQQLNLFFIYTAKELPDFNITREKVNVILNKLIKIANENNSSNS
jgi:ribonuclease P protein component